MAAPMATPLNAATIGPAAMKGPTPGIARAPMPRDPAQGSNDDPAGGRAGDGTFRSFGVLLMREVMSGPLVSEQRGDVVVGELLILERIDNAELLNNLISLIARGGDAEYRFL